MQGEVLLEMNVQGTRARNLVRMKEENDEAGKQRES